MATGGRNQRVNTTTNPEPEANFAHLIRSCRATASGDTQAPVGNDSLLGLDAAPMSVNPAWSSEKHPKPDHAQSSCDPGSRATQLPTRSLYRTM